MLYLSFIVLCTLKLNYTYFKNALKYRIYMLSNFKIILELTGYFLEVKNRKTTSARRQTTATEAAL